jgi:hypothetical protein
MKAAPVLQYTQGPESIDQSLRSSGVEFYL